MAIDLNDEILQDFLVEAGEILDQLGEQLVELERSPDDLDLLNAVFRGFHTVKGGAGFLGLNALVEVCHRAEDVFNLLRQGERQVNSQLMDTILQVTDVVNEMMNNIRAGEEPAQASPELIQALEATLRGESMAEAAAPQAPEAPTAESEINAASAPEAEFVDDATADPSVSEEGEEITEDEFEALLDELQGKPQSEATPEPAAAAPVGGDGDEITEEEFEALLDQLHGDAAAPSTGGQDNAAPSTDSAAAPGSENASPAAGGAGSEEEITDDEFEALLDELEAKKQTSPGAAAEPEQAAASSAPARPAAASKETSEPAAEKPADTQPAPAKPAAAKPAKEAAVAETSVRVDTKRLDDIMNLVGELVLVRNRMATLRTTMSADAEVSKAIANLDLVTADLQSSVMKTRMQPIKKVFGRFPRVVRDLARSLKKEVNLELIGEETDLDKNLVEALADPLVHLVRNSVDHGIEMPEEREQAGKDRVGTVVLSAQQEGDHILLMIEDDGKGMDANKLRQIAVEKGVIDEDTAARLDEKACYNLIFAPGFSTKSEISDISGRGVGMDVVKTRIAQLNGAIEIDSTLGRGSRIVIKLPLTLAIMPTLMVVLGEQVFALPLANVSEIFDMESARLSTVDGREVVIIREKAVPLVRLSSWLVNGSAANSAADGDGFVVVTAVGNQLIGCVVDQLVGQEEVVIKPLGAMLHGTKGISGATITGNGGIALILDMPGLMDAYAGRL